MGELFFVLKTMAVSLLVVALMQVKAGDMTLEQKAQIWLQKSEVSLYLQKVASAAILFAQNSTQTISRFVSQSFGSAEPSHEARASKLNIEFKRSRAFEEQKEK